MLEGKGLSLATLAQELPILYTVLEGKKLEKKGIEGSVIQLSEKSAVVSLDVSLELMTNLKMNLKDVDEKLSSYDFYGKVVEHSVKDGNSHMLRFTSVPPEVDAYFKAHLRYAENSPIRE